MKNINRFNTNIQDFNKRFNEHFKQYITDYKGNNSEDELEYSFKVLLVNNNNSKPESIDKDILTAFITLPGNSLTEFTTLTTINLPIGPLYTGL